MHCLQHAEPLEAGGEMIRVSVLLIRMNAVHVLILQTGFPGMSLQLVLYFYQSHTGQVLNKGYC